RFKGEMLNPEEEVDAEVTWADQQLINKFRNLNDALEDFENKEIEYMEDLSSELELSDEDDKLKIGDTFFLMSVTDCQDRLKTEQEEMEQELQGIKSTISDTVSKMDELKKKLKINDIIIHRLSTNNCHVAQKATKMKVLCIAILEQTRGDAVIRAIDYELSSISFFLRGTVQEGLRFLATTVVTRTQPGSRSKIEQDPNVGHVFVRHDGLAGVVVADAEYPTRAAQSVIGRALEDFEQKFPRNRWQTLTAESTSAVYPELKLHLSKIQDPSSADPFLRVQRELDETKIVMHKTLDSLLARGEKLDDLVDRSNQLSTQSK
ncbi:palmitoyltransferase, partial [Nowakowskiella sp. JEL0078]